MGKKLKYTEREFERRSNEYICSVRYKRQIVDASGVPIKNDLGEDMYEYIYPEPPSMAGWALYLGMSRRTLGTHYRQRYPEVFERIKTVLEAYNVKELLSRKTGAEPVKFNLQNNYGWRDTRSEANGTRAEAPSKDPIALSDKISLAEKGE